MVFKISGLTVLLCIATASIVYQAAYADRAYPPVPRRVFSSSNGCVAAWISTSTRQASSRIQVVQYLDDGSEKELWATNLSYIPVRLFVGHKGDVVAIDRWGALGQDKSIVYFDMNGVKKKELSLDDILTPKEIERNVITTVSNRFWARRMIVWFNRDSVDLSLEWGKRLVLLRDSGELVHTSPKE